MKSNIATILLREYKAQLSLLESADERWVDALYSGAREIGLGERETVHWIYAPMYSLGNISPIAFVDSAEKLDQALGLLLAVENGGFA